MSKPKRKGRCAYCGNTRPLTRDHIPPESFFPKPRASNLITVPCCEPCRAGWAEDDEYFRAVILSTAQVYEVKEAQPLIDSLLRSVSNPAKRGFAKMLTGSIRDVQLKTEAGIYLGNTPALKVDRGRISRVAQRIVRGLFFHEKKYSVPNGYEALGYIQQFGIDPILEKLEGVEFPAVRDIQDGVFCYTFRQSEDDANSGILLALFYGSLPFVGFVRKLPAFRVMEAL